VTTRIYLSAALLHLHSFYLHDDSTLRGYTERVSTLYQTAYNFLSQCLEADNPDDLFNYWPFFCYQAYVAAALTVLKILMSGCFDSIIDIPAGKVPTQLGHPHVTKNVYCQQRSARSLE
jgi:hypothetical protein